MSQDRIDLTGPGLGNDDFGSVKLKIPPKVCSRCGGKYIPTSNAQKICPVCKNKEKSAPHSKAGKDLAAVFGSGGQ